MLADPFGVGGLDFLTFDMMWKQLSLAAMVRKCGGIPLSMWRGVRGVAHIKERS
jgi:hypothetical protein